jgi:hypothetical protein
MDKSKKVRNADHVRRQNRPTVSDEVVEQRLKDLVSSYVFGQLAYFQRLKLRARILSLPVMIAAVLTMLWRQVPSVHELRKLICREDFLWSPQINVSQQALSKRFLTLPAELFKRVFMDILPLLKRRALERTRPQPESITLARNNFDEVFAVDGSTLEALFRKLKSLEDVAAGTLAGKICTVIDLVTRFPVQCWEHKDPLAHDTNFINEIKSFAKAGTLWIFDRGFYDFIFFKDLIDQGVAWITRIKSNTKYKVKIVLLDSPHVRDQIILLTGKEGCFHPLRLVEVRFGKTWYKYLTSITDPSILSAVAVADIYRRRWRIEESFMIIKRLLGLSYLWTGSENGVMLQVWATWLFYSILIDLGDAVAEELNVPFDRISLEMTFRGLYHFSVAHSKGLAEDPIEYFTAPENRDLGVLKVLRKAVHKSNNCIPQPDLGG